MYKIHRLLLLLTLSISFPLQAQQLPDRAATTIRTLQKTVVFLTNRQADPVVETPLPTYSENNTQANRKTVFTLHPLADQVELGQKHMYDVLTGGQKASLPYPIVLQTQSLRR